MGHGSGHIYGLQDPREPGVTRYVGRTLTSLPVRLARHVIASEKDTAPVNVWVAGIVAVGLSPVIVLLDRVDEGTIGDLRALEQHWIDELLASGRLLNLEGTPEYRAHKVARLHASQTPESRERGAAKRRGKSFHTPEQIEAARKQMTGRKLTPEHRAKLLAATKGKKRSPETCAKIAQATKQRWKSGAFDSPDCSARQLAALARGRANVRQNQSGRFERRP